jgi:hypothetical protein
MMTIEETNLNPIPLVAFLRPLVVLILSAFSLSGCGQTIDWTQEAPLHDGRILVVERRSERGPPFPGSTGLEVGQTLAFVHPDTNERIKWRIPDGLQPVMIDFDRGVPHYVLKEYTVSDYNKWGCPNPPYLVFRYQKGEWTRVAFEGLPASFLNRNLMTMSKDAQGLKDGGRVSADQVESFWYAVERPKPRHEARRLSREKISPIGKGCFESVLIKQGRQSEIDNRR